MEYNSKNLANIKETLLKLSGVIIFLVIWEAAPRLGWADKQFVPSFSTALNELYRLLMSGDLSMHIMVTFWRVLLGLIISIIIAVPMSFILESRYPFLVEILNPLLRLLSQVNPFSITPIFVLFFGAGELVKLAMIAWVCLWPILFNTITGIKVVDPLLIKSAKALNISSMDLFAKVMVPSVSPFIFTGLRTGVEMSFYMVIAAEMIGSSSGLGWLVHNSGMNYQIPRIYASAICIVLLGVILKRFLGYLGERFFYWKVESSFDVQAKRHKKIDKSEIAFILFMLVFIITFGTWQVIQADYESKNMEVHDHLGTVRSAGGDSQ
ncbi:MAG TPA: ABC transporter permease [Clostridia bacterium]